MLDGGTANTKRKIDVRKLLLVSRAREIDLLTPLTLLTLTS